MRSPALIEAMKNVTVLKFRRDRNPPGGQATIQVPGHDRNIEVWWHEPPKGQPLTVHFKPYPQGWAELSLAEQSEASKQLLLAITMHNVAATKAKAEPQKPSPRKRRR